MLKILMRRKELSTAQKQLEDLRKKMAEFETREAELLGCREGVYIRFHWLDEGPKTYF